jgi:hypothetical protein
MVATKANVLRRSWIRWITPRVRFLGLNDLLLLEDMMGVEKDNVGVSLKQGRYTYTRRRHSCSHSRHINSPGGLMAVLCTRCIGKDFEITMMCYSALSETNAKKLSKQG